MAGLEDLVAAGAALRAAGRTDEARATFSEALSLAREGGDALGAARALWQLWLVEPDREAGRPWVVALQDELLPVLGPGAPEEALRLWSAADHVLGTCLAEVCERG